MSFLALVTLHLYKNVSSKLTKAQSGQIAGPVKSVHCLLLVISVPLCQTSCPLRTVHYIMIYLFKNICPHCSFVIVWKLSLLHMISKPAAIGYNIHVNFIYPMCHVKPRYMTSVWHCQQMRGFHDDASVYYVNSFTVPNHILFTS